MKIMEIIAYVMKSSLKNLLLLLNSTRLNVLLSHSFLATDNYEILRLYLGCRFYEHQSNFVCNLEV